ncbi:MAG: VOC family protein [Pseudomonadota bacterium]
MNDISWGHININVTDLDRSIAFYEKFGFEIFLPSIPYLGLSDAPGEAPLPAALSEALGMGRETAGRGCIMQLKQQDFPKIDLTELVGRDAQATCDPLENQDNGFVRICLLTEDLQATYERLVDDGVGFLTEPVEADGELVLMATCRDPDGALIELLEVRYEKWAAHLGQRQ